MAGYSITFYFDDHPASKIFCPSSPPSNTEIWACTCFWIVIVGIIIRKLIPSHDQDFERHFVERLRNVEEDLRDMVQKTEEMKQETNELREEKRREGERGGNMGTWMGECSANMKQKHEEFNAYGTREFMEYREEKRKSDELFAEVTRRSKERWEERRRRGEWVLEDISREDCSAKDNSD